MAGPVPDWRSRPGIDEIPCMNPLSPTGAPEAPASHLARLPLRLSKALEAYAERVDIGVIRDAYEMAAEAHAGQMRASGESYVSHTVEVATILANLRLDTASLVAGLIHDVVEDTAITLDEVRSRFGSEVATIVDGVTKIGRVEFRSSTEAQVENYRKLLLSMSADARVILVKLADRLHNMRTLEHLLPEKRKRIARETMDIYAPLAHRLGMAEIKWELEDLSFKFLEPQAYEQLSSQLQERRVERERKIERMRIPLEEALAEAGIPAEVTGRPKHLWSIFRKMDRRGVPFEEIYDLMAMRVITDSIPHCYAALGVIHSRWTPIQERFHDYIATPKTNMYRSIHTTVVGPGGRRYEVQIRTEEMHRTAELGIAAHWKYKERGAPRTGGTGSDVDDALTWFRQVLEWQQDAGDPEEFMEFLRMDLFQGEIFVFTPKGEVKELPAGASPIDFAFAVHTEVGLHCAGAKVNGRIAPLSRELRNGDTVEVITNPRQWPSRDWLAFVKTTRARQRIRQWIKNEEFDASVRIGRDLLDRELRKARRDRPGDGALDGAARQLGMEGGTEFLAAIGRGDLAPRSAVKTLHPDVEDDTQRTPTPLERIATRLRRSPKGVRIQGMDSLMVRYSQCCQPVPGDDVIGYISVGRGISIHRRDCPNALALSQDPERRVEIEWSAEQGERFFVRLVVEGDDRPGILSEIARAISDTGTNIRQADVRTAEDGMRNAFVVEVQDLGHLHRVIAAIRRIRGITRVERGESLAEADLPPKAR